MGRGKGHRVEDLAVRGGAASVLVAVPARHSLESVIGFPTAKRRAPGEKDSQEERDREDAPVHTRTSPIWSVIISFSASRIGSTSSRKKVSTC